eukprot:m.858224 g.858224  ORF g.858224 m.858224 type:complete len:163 (+) comp23521_c1_seq2:244-732(+)
MWSLDLLDPQATWVTHASMRHPRNHIGAAAIGGKFYAIGGQLLELEGCSNQDAAEVYDPATDTWTDLPPLPQPLGHITPSTFAVDGAGIVIISGVTDKSSGCSPPGKVLRQALYYNPTAAVWYTMGFKVKGASMVSGVIGNHVYVIDRDNELQRVEMLVTTD